MTEDQRPGADRAPRESIPRGGFRRTARLASLPAAHAGRTLVGLGRRLAGNAGEAVTAELQQRTAEQVFAVLGELKGGAMKFGQALSAMEAALPPRLVGPYRAALVRLQEAAPPLPTPVVHRVLDRGLGADWQGQFNEFSRSPVAAASIGQVHRAVWKDGRDVAVKIQYPHAAEALVTDMRHLHRIAPLLRVAAPNLDARAFFREMDERLREETDYLHEAEVQRAFASAYRGDPEIFVPDVVEAGAGVLVMEWTDGKPLADVISSGEASERDRCGDLLVKLLLSGPVRAGLLHGDPHPGNFRLLADGRLGVLDFGSSEVLTGWSLRVGRLLSAGRDRDAESSLATLVEAGMVDRERVSAMAVLELLEPVLAPLRVDRFTFTREWLQGLTMAGADPRSEVARTQRRLRLPARHVLMQRVVAGLGGVLCSLNATVSVSSEVERWVPGFHA